MSTKKKPLSLVPEHGSDYYFEFHLLPPPPRDSSKDAIAKFLGDGMAAAIRAARDLFEVEPRSAVERDFMKDLLADIETQCWAAAKALETGEWPKVRDFRGAESPHAAELLATAALAMQERGLEYGLEPDFGPYARCAGCR